MKDKLVKSTLLIWAIVLCCSSVILGIWHHSDFSKLGKISRLTFNTESKWQIVHFLGGECQCSNYIVDYLINRGPSQDYIEKIIVFDDTKDFKDRLEKSGFKVNSLDYEETPLENKPDGIPLLVIANPLGHVLYEGGYAPTMLNPFTKINDLEIARKFANKDKKEDVKSYPAYGCYMSKKYRRWLDPTNLKYKGEI